MLARWSELVEGRRSLQARSRLVVDDEMGHGGEERRIRSRQDLQLERPSRLRVAIQGPLRTSVAVLVTDGDRYLLRGVDGSRESGVVEEGMLWQLAGLDLNPEEAVNLLLGMPRLPDPRGRRTRSALRGGGVRVELLDTGGAAVSRLDFDPQGRLQSYEAGDDAARLVVRFSDYGLVGGSPFAHRIEVGTGRARAELQLSDVALNPELAEGVFRLDDPGNAWSSWGRGE